MHHQKLQKQLEEFGFTPQQAKLYLAGLMWGHGLMAQLARTAGIKRTTAYYIMPELIRRRFFRIIKFGKRAGYKAAEPKELLQMTKNREKLIKKLLPKLNRIQN